MQTRCTLAEIRAQAAKAARGAGCPWGVAEEVGLAARQLEARGLPAVAQLASLLTASRACRCTGQKGGDAPACGIAEMVRLSDSPPTTNVALGSVAAPVLLLAAFLDYEPGKKIRWSTGSATVGQGQVCVSGNLPPDRTYVTLGPLVAAPQGPAAQNAFQDTEKAARQDTGQDAMPRHHSRLVPTDAWDTLTAFAAKTYVPETEASRARGAGPDG